MGAEGRRDVKLIFDEPLQLRISRELWGDIEERLREETDELTLPVGSVSWDEGKRTITLGSMHAQEGRRLR